MHTRSLLRYTGPHKAISNKRVFNYVYLKLCHILPHTMLFLENRICLNEHKFRLGVNMSLTTSFTAFASPCGVAATGEFAFALVKALAVISARTQSTWDRWQIRIKTLSYWQAESNTLAQAATCILFILELSLNMSYSNDHNFCFLVPKKLLWNC
jgi:hypothetical protein